MALIAFVKGINVGGHRNFRPTTLAAALGHLGVINVGAAGTFIVRKRVSRRQLREEIQKRLPFTAAIAICDGRDVVSLASLARFAGQPAGPAVVQFVGVLAKRSQSTVRPPLDLPPTGPWCVRMFAHRHPFVLGVHRREMKALSYLGQLEKAVGVPMTIRSWTTIQTIARILEE